MGSPDPAAALREVREALQEIVGRGEVFDARGTWSARVNALSARALSLLDALEPVPGTWRIAPDEDGKPFLFRDDDGVSQEYPPVTVLRRREET